MTRSSVAPAGIRSSPGSWPLAAGSGGAGGHDDGPVAVPAAVRDAVARRVAALPAATREVLATAAVVGGALLPDVLVAATGRDPADVDAAVAAAAAAGMLVERAGGGPVHRTTC